MPGPNTPEAVRIPVDALAVALDVPQPVVRDVLALQPDDLAENLAVTAVEHEHKLGNMLRTDEAINTLVVLSDEVDWAAADPETRVAAAVFGLRLLGKLGIIRIDMGVTE